VLIVLAIGADSGGAGCGAIGGGVTAGGAATLAGAAAGVGGAGVITEDFLKKHPQDIRSARESNGRILFINTRLSFFNGTILFLTLRKSQKKIKGKRSFTFSYFPEESAPFRKLSQNSCSSAESAE
jgi:hypothetical protein